MEPDYKNYSLEDLHSVTERIDRDKYPERYEKVLLRIQELESSEDMSEDDRTYVEVSKGLGSKLGCERVILTGCFGGLFVTFSTLILSFGIQDTEYRTDILISVGLYALLTVFLYFKSRISATLLFALYFFSLVQTWFVDLQPRGLVGGVLLSIIFFAAMLGTFVWHKRYQNGFNEETDEYET